MNGPYGQDDLFVFWVVVIGFVFLCVVGLIEWWVTRRR